MKIKSLWFMSLAALVLAGCSSTPPLDNGKQDTDDSKKKDDDDKGDYKKPAPAPDSPELVAAVSSFFKQKCSECHSPGVALGGINDILDVVALRADNLIGDSADGSALFRVVNNKHQEGRTQPRSKKKVELPNDQEIEFLRLWLDAGAAPLRGNRERIALSDYQAELVLDKSSVPRSEQNELVYISFHEVYNNDRFSDAEIQAFANASLKLLNELDVFSTSPKRNGVAVVPNRDNNIPLAIRFNPRSFNLDKQRDIIDTLIRLANRQDINNPFTFNGGDNPCDVPHINVLDFLHLAASDDIFNVLGDGGQGTFESAYSNIALRQLLVKEGFLNEDQLVFDAISEQQFIQNGFTNISPNTDVFEVLAAVDPINFNRQTLDILYNAGNDDERVVRGAMLNSNVSAANRVIDRLAQSSPPGGATYISFDALSFNNVNQNKDFFEAGFVGPANPANDPLVRPQDGFQPFEIDGGEGIYQLQNSMLGFFAYNANFQLVSNPPTLAVQNLGNLERGSLIAVSACSYCHASFTIPFEDALLPTLLGSKNGREFGEAGFAFKFAQVQEDWDAVFDLDAQFYQDVLRQIYVSKSENGDLADGIWSLGIQRLNDLTNDDLAAVLGFRDVELLLDRVDDITDLSADLASVNAGGVSYENLIANYQALVEQVSVGDKDFLRGCVAREASDAGDFGDQDNGSDNGSNDGVELPDSPTGTGKAMARPVRPRRRCD